MFSNDYMEKGEGVGKESPEKERHNALLTPFLFVIAQIEMIIVLGPLHGLIAVVKFVLNNFASSQTNVTQSKKPRLCS